LCLECVHSCMNDALKLWFPRQVWFLQVELFIKTNWFLNWLKY
jgi:hypothetical protein